MIKVHSKFYLLVMILFVAYIGFLTFGYEPTDLDSVNLHRKMLLIADLVVIFLGFAMVHLNGMPDMLNFPWWFGMIYWNIYYIVTSFFATATVLTWWNFAILTFTLLFALWLQMAYGTATLRDYKTEGPYEVGFKSFYSKVH